ncbi:hypothetical protein GGS23DRAFT_607225 [Durotheca rogersii]|uniref:uncharacterized protein n=1 Tax=Durotheca rogersii TaxID=419775 RepID=UPI002220BC08|nr:uncharacterized protein GGS23DRAFT_607225 [Durotheca rogersii]KAI5860033.1 hypothetical protein GGS23DRAFT_607225 [Durotheca rogersii]
MNRKAERTPLALGLLEHPELVDPQCLSPLFSKLPRELRELIWQFALTGYENVDKPFGLEQRFTRPGQAARLRIAVQILLTCRAIYVETYLIPFQANPIVVFDGNMGDVPFGNPLLRTASRQLLCDKLRLWQFAQISSVDMTAQQYTLEGGSLERVSRLIGTLERHRNLEFCGFNLAGYAQFFKPSGSESSAGESSDASDAGRNMINPLVSRKITHLTLRMNRTDWWTWSTPPEIARSGSEERLRLEPMMNTTVSNPAIRLMTQGNEARKQGQEPDFGLDDFEKEGRWGPQITTYWPSLETLDLVLETFSCKEDQLDYVVECAKLWTFPLEDSYVLTWDGNVDKTRWRGASSYEYEYDAPWAPEQNRGANVESGDYSATRWKRMRNYETWPNRSQEFVVRTIRYERRHV